MKKTLWLLYQPYKYLIYIPFLALSTLLFGSLAVIFAFLTNPRIASFIGGAVWARLNGWVALILVTVKNREQIDKKQSYVIVSNHQSHFDVFVLYGWLGIDFKWVLKQELRKVPGLGIGCEKVGHIFIDRSNREAAIASIEAAKSKVKDGTSVIFFPEGSRSKTGELGTFKKGAFHMALDLGLPILPITVVGTQKILPSGTIDLFPGRASIVIHKPVPTDDYDKENIQPLLDRVHDAIASGLPEE